ncbi:hypothetical protein PoB_002565500 [Plakobranchus ocellatus]|uniref:Uncharacterized protein n=1 Tax=Plakobranchus ocellatus TaxID=259542 RepID=A0AAV3ZVD8_9GAST|nr:hypothetical protein PoB_002565500 [Plakobranchus ocellatus]
MGGQIGLASMACCLRNHFKNVSYRPSLYKCRLVILHKRGACGTVTSESALRSAGTLLSQARSPPPAPWPDIDIVSGEDVQVCHRPGEQTGARRQTTPLTRPKQNKDSEGDKLNHTVNQSKIVESELMTSNKGSEPEPHNMSGKSTMRTYLINDLLNSEKRKKNSWQKKKDELYVEIVCYTDNRKPRSTEYRRNKISVTRREKGRKWRKKAGGR